MSINFGLLIFIDERPSELGTELDAIHTKKFIFKVYVLVLAMLYCPSKSPDRAHVWWGAG